MLQSSPKMLLQQPHTEHPQCASRFSAKRHQDGWDSCPGRVHSQSGATETSMNSSILWALIREYRVTILLWASVSFPHPRTLLVTSCSTLALSFSDLVTRMESHSQKVTVAKEPWFPEGWVEKPEANFFLLTCQVSSLLSQESMRKDPQRSVHRSRALWWEGRVGRSGITSSPSLYPLNPYLFMSKCQP